MSKCIDARYTNARVLISMADYETLEQTLAIKMALRLACSDLDRNDKNVYLRYLDRAKQILEIEPPKIAEGLMTPEHYEKYRKLSDTEKELLYDAKLGFGIVDYSAGIHELGY